PLQRRRPVPGVGTGAGELHGNGAPVPEEAAGKAEAEDHPLLERLDGGPEGRFRAGSRAAAEQAEVIDSGAKHDSSFRARTGAGAPVGSGAEKQPPPCRGCLLVKRLRIPSHDLFCTAGRFPHKTIRRFGRNHAKNFFRSSRRELPTASCSPAAGTPNTS